MAPTDNNAQGGGGTATTGAGWAGSSFRARQIVLPVSMHPVHAFRAHVYSLLTDANNPVSVGVLVLMTAAIALSVIAFAVQTLPVYRLRVELGQVGEPERVFEAIEWVMLILFSVDYLARLLTVSAVPVPSELAHLAHLATTGRRAPLLTVRCGGCGGDDDGGGGGAGALLELPMRSPGSGGGGVGGRASRHLYTRSSTSASLGGDSSGASVLTWADSRSPPGEGGEGGGAYPDAAAATTTTTTTTTILDGAPAGDSGAGTGLAPRRSGARPRLVRSASAPEDGGGLPSQARRRWGVLRDAVLGAHNMPNDTTSRATGRKSSRALLLSAAAAFNAAPHNPDASAVHADEGEGGGGSRRGGGGAGGGGGGGGGGDSSAARRRRLSSRDEGLVACGFGLSSRLPLTLRKLLAFGLAPLNVVDLVAILPFYIPMSATSDAAGGAGGARSLYIARVLRMGRVFSLLKLTRHHSGLAVMVDAMAASAHMLAFLLFLVLLAAMFAGAFIFILESGEWVPEEAMWMRPDVLGTGTEESPFKSMPHGIYWALTTLTTTGYGDMYPTTLPGRAFACVTMLAGAMVIALPITVLSANFGVKYAEFNATRAERNKLLAQWKRQARLNSKLAADEAHARAARAARLASSAGGGPGSSGSGGGSGITMLAHLSPGSLLKRTWGARSIAAAGAGVSRGSSNRSVTALADGAPGGGGGGGGDATAVMMPASPAAPSSPPPLPSHGGTPAVATSPATGGSIGGSAAAGTGGSSQPPSRDGSRRGGALAALVTHQLPHKRVFSSSASPSLRAAASPIPTAGLAAGADAAAHASTRPSPAALPRPAASPAPRGAAAAAAAGVGGALAAMPPLHLAGQAAPSRGGAAPLLRGAGSGGPITTAAGGALMSPALGSESPGVSGAPLVVDSGGDGELGGDAARHAARVRAEALTRVRAKAAAEATAMAVAAAAAVGPAAAELPAASAPPSQHEHSS